MDKSDEHEKHIALVFSIIFPGAGLLYQRKWLSGIISGVIHLLITGLLFVRTIFMIHYGIEGISSEEVAIETFLFIGIFINWFYSIRATQNFE